MAQEVGASPVTRGLRISTPAPSVSVVECVGE